jgi:hypothetical protein
LHNAALICKFAFISRGRAVVARRAHNPKVAGSSPALATITIKRLYYYSVTVFLYLSMSKRIFYPLFLLLIPLIGMTITDEINWSPFDFIIMGSLLIFLSIGINFVSNRTKNLKNRVLYIGILVIIFMLIWAELAVGLFGTPFAGS